MTDIAVGESEGGVDASGNVQDVRKQWAVFEDGAMAHRLQSEEIDHHYNVNRSHRRTAREDVPLARVVQTEEELEAQRTRMYQLEEASRRASEDEHLAQVMQEKLRVKEEEQKRMHLDDKEIARALQQQTRSQGRGSRHDAPHASDEPLYANRPHGPTQRSRGAADSTQRSKGAADSMGQGREEQAAGGRGEQDGERQSGSRRDRGGQLEEEDGLSPPVTDEELARRMQAREEELAQRQQQRTDLRQRRKELQERSEKLSRGLSGGEQSAGRVEGGDDYRPRRAVLEGKGDQGDFSQFLIPADPTLNENESKLLQEEQDAEIARLLQEQEQKRSQVIAGRGEHMKAMVTADAELAKIMQEEETLKAQRRELRRKQRTLEQKERKRGSTGSRRKNQDGVEEHGAFDTGYGSSDRQQKGGSVAEREYRNKQEQRTPPSANRRVSDRQEQYPVSNRKSNDRRAQYPSSNGREEDRRENYPHSSSRAEDRRGNHSLANNNLDDRRNKYPSTSKGRRDGPPHPSSSDTFADQNQSSNSNKGSEHAHNKSSERQRSERRSCRDERKWNDNDDRWDDGGSGGRGGGRGGTSGTTDSSKTSGSHRTDRSGGGNDHRPGKGHESQQGERKHGYEHGAQDYQRGVPDAQCFQTPGKTSAVSEFGFNVVVPKSQRALPGESLGGGGGGTRVGDIRGSNSQNSGPPRDAGESNSSVSHQNNWAGNNPPERVGPSANPTQSSSRAFRVQRSLDDGKHSAKSHLPTIIPAENRADENGGCEGVVMRKKPEGGNQRPSSHWRYSSPNFPSSAGRQDRSGPGPANRQARSGSGSGPGSVAPNERQPFPMGGRKLIGIGSGNSNGVSADDRGDTRIPHSVTEPAFQSVAGRESPHMHVSNSDSKFVSAAARARHSVHVPDMMRHRSLVPPLAPTSQGGQRIEDSGASRQFQQTATELEWVSRPSGHAPYHHQVMDQSHQREQSGLVPVPGPINGHARNSNHALESNSVLSTSAPGVSARERAIAAEPIYNRPFAVPFSGEVRQPVGMSQHTDEPIYDKPWMSPDEFFGSAMKEGGVPVIPRPPAMNGGVGGGLGVRSSGAPRPADLHLSVGPRGTHGNMEETSGPISPASSGGAGAVQREQVLQQKYQLPGQLSPGSGQRGTPVVGSPSEERESNWSAVRGDKRTSSQRRRSKKNQGCKQQ